MDKIRVILFTLPQAACGANKVSWVDVAKMLHDNLEHSFPAIIEFRHIEFMSPEWFDDPQAQNLLELQHVQFPFILVNDEIACAEAKVNFSKVKKYISKIIDN